METVHSKQKAINNCDDSLWLQAGTSGTFLLVCVHKRGGQENIAWWEDKLSTLKIGIVCPRHGSGIHRKTLCTLGGCGPDVVLN